MKQTEQQIQRAIKLIIPVIFTSVNHQYGISRWGKRYLTDEAETYMEAVRYACSYRGEPITAPINVEVWYYFPNHRRRDILNDKLTWDALEGMIYKDDKQIAEAHIYKRYDSDNPRTEIIVSEVADKVK